MNLQGFGMRVFTGGIRETNGTKEKGNRKFRKQKTQELIAIFFFSV
jgi:hypothetical protein